MKNVIITGANSGLGFETAKKIAYDSGYRIILACRNEEKASAARDKIVEETGNSQITVMHLDTSSLESVRSFVKEITEKGERIYALVNNAGISSRHSGMTEEGFEIVFATNYLGHFYLTLLLLPQMEDEARIINVSSDMHNPPGGLEWPGMEEMAHPSKDDPKRYSYSKLCNIHFTYELDWRLRKNRSFIAVNAFNPGFMADTNFSGGSGKVREAAVRIAMPERYGNLEASSEALAQLITSDEVAGISGKYFDRSTKYTNTSMLSYSTGHALEMWDKSLEYCGLDEEYQI